MVGDSRPFVNRYAPDMPEITVVEGDLTALEVEAVVNAANDRLVHGGGLAAAIVRRGGRVIQTESDAWVHEYGPLSPGTAAVTGAGDLPARLVIHVAGPRYRGDGDDEELLRSAVRAALQAAEREGVDTIALPAISAGIFGYPLEEATTVIASEVVAWTGDHDRPSSINLVGFDGTVADAFRTGLAAAQG